ncbi:MAG: hydroxyacid dehydrogenase [Caldilineales bacterium]|nr:hydroxyacid dehydrogenase [Caldilineales bacterium]
MTLHAHLLFDVAAEHLADLRRRLDPDIAITTGKDLPEGSGVHILVVGRPRREQLAACPDLRAVIVPWAGIPPETRALLADFPHISLHNLHHNAIATAETAMALLLAAAKYVLPLDAALRRHDWTPRYELPDILTLQGRTALILGFGAIGQHLARLCQAFGMQILAIRRRPDAPLPADLRVAVHPPAALPDLLAGSDVLLIALPETEETRGWIGADELARMPRGSLLVNVGRGPVVDEQALFAALQSGHLAGAGIDVWYAYPASKEERSHTPPSAYPFHELANVVLSPHRGGAAGTEETERQRNAELARLLNAAARGQPLPNQVDLKRGY